MNTTLRLQVGGITGRIGDPSGKSEERPSLGEEDLQYNMHGIQKSAERVFEGIAQCCNLSLYDIENLQEKKHMSKWVGERRNQEKNKREIIKPIVLDNSTFYKDMPLWEFFGKVGRYFRLSSMLAKETVANRLSADSSGMSFTEFSYQIFQAYDFLHLFLHYGCVLQIGGSDQWGNIVAGTDLIKRARNDFSSLAFHSSQQVAPEGLTVPLLTTATGAKFGKSEGNAVWIEPHMTSNVRSAFFLGLLYTLAVHRFPFCMYTVSSLSVSPKCR